MILVVLTLQNVFKLISFNNRMERTLSAVSSHFVAKLSILSGFITLVTQLWAWRALYTLLSKFLLMQSWNTQKLI